MKKASVLKEIATELNLSINSVSRALRDCSDISEKTKERVRRKAIEMGYIQNTLSRLLVDDDKQLIAIIVRSFDNPYYTSFVQSFIEHSHQSNYTFMVLPFDYENVDVNAVKQCISQRVSFIITLCPISDKAIEYCQLNRIPICTVGFDSKHPYCSSVLPDYKQMVSLTTKYLFDQYGNRDLVYCSKSFDYRENTRHSMLRDVWNELCPGRNVLWYTLEDKDKIAEICYENEKCLFCYNDEVAYTLMRHIKRKYGPSFDMDNLKIAGIDGISVKVCGMTDITSGYCDFSEMIPLIQELIKETSKNPELRVNHLCGACLHIKGEA